MLQALRSRDIGAGAVLARHEAALADRRGPRVLAEDDDLSQPLALHTAQVAPDWVDYNGHAHESRYLQVFGDASDALYDYLGIDEAYRERGSYFTVETHLSHLREALLDDRLAVTTQVLDCDARRLHVFHSLYRSTMARCWRLPSSSPCTSTRSPGAPRRPARRCLPAPSASPARTPHCRDPSARGARSASRTPDGRVRPWRR